VRLHLGIQLPPALVAVAGLLVIALGVWRGNPIAVAIGVVVIAIAGVRAFIL